MSDSEQDYMDREGILFADRDDCKFCLGFKGGTRGNENMIAGYPVCDYCHALFIAIRNKLNGDACNGS
jgi:hypothetical protein